MTVQVPRPKPAKLVQVWLTRDSDAHGVWDMVDVWIKRPTRYVDPSGGAYWCTGDPSNDKADRVHVGAKSKYRTLPDDDRQIVHCYIKGV